MRKTTLRIALFGLATWAGALTTGCDEGERRPQGGAHDPAVCTEASIYAENCLAQACNEGNAGACEAETTSPGTCDETAAAVARQMLELSCPDLLGQLESTGKADATCASVDPLLDAAGIDAGLLGDLTCWHPDKGPCIKILGLCPFEQPSPESVCQAAGGECRPGDGCPNGSAQVDDLMCSESTTCCAEVTCAEAGGSCLQGNECPTGQQDAAGSCDQGGVCCIALECTDVPDALCLPLGVYQKAGCGEGRIENPALSGCSETSVCCTPGADPNALPDPDAPGDDDEADE